MAIQFACNVCSQILSVAEQHQGKKVRCPKCQTALTVPGAGGPSASEQVQGRPGAPPPPPMAQPYPQREPPPPPRSRDRYDDDYDRRDDRRGGYGRRDDYERRDLGDEREQWQSVAVGLSFHAWRHYIFMTMIFLGLIMMLVSMFMFLGRGGGRGPEEFIQVLAIGMFILGCILLLLYYIFGFVGYGFCSKTPPASGAGALNMTAMILEICCLVILGINVLLGMVAANSRGRDGEALGIIALLLSVLWLIMFLTGEILFLVYINRTAHYAGSPTIAGRAIGAMIGWLITVVGGGLIVILVGVFMESSRAMRGDAGPFLMLFIFAGWLVTWAIMCALIAGVCGALKRKVSNDSGSR